MSDTNIINDDFRMTDLLNLLKKDIMISLNCHALATVESFDATKQTVQASMNYLKSYVQTNIEGVQGTITPKYPLLIDVPVVILQGGGFGLTFPVQKGDTCLILFNDRQIDKWLHSGQVVAPEGNRFHHFADGIALVGLRSLNKAIQNYDPDRAVLGNLDGASQALVAVGDRIEISNVSANFKTELDLFLTAIETFCSACSGSADATLVAAAAALNTSTVAIKAQIDLVLE